MTGDAGDSSTASPPILVVHDQASDDEIAALLAVLALSSPATAATREGARSGWADPERRLRQLPRPGADAWRRSALPR